jgi:hypothetical protein
MTATHGTQRRYVEGCRCGDCKEAHRVSARDYRERRASGQTRPASVVAIPSAVVSEPSGPGPVESGVVSEIVGLAQAEARPGLAQAALALARIMDNPRAVNQQPAAAAKLADILDRLRKGADARRSRLASVRQMTAKTGASE